MASNKDIIKSKNPSIDISESLNDIPNHNKKVSKAKADINSAQIEQNYKKSVANESSVEKTIKKPIADDDTPKVSYRDYSGRIKYDNIQRNNNTPYNNEPFNVHNAETNSTVNEQSASVIKENNSSQDIIKHNSNSSSEIIKSADDSKAIKSTEPIVNDSIKGNTYNNRTNKYEAENNNISSSHKKSFNNSNKRAFKYRKNQNTSENVINEKAPINEVVKKEKSTVVKNVVVNPGEIVKDNSNSPIKSVSSDLTKEKNSSNVKKRKNNDFNKIFKKKRNNDIKTKQPIKASTENKSVVENSSDISNNDNEVFRYTDNSAPAGITKATDNNSVVVEDRKLKVEVNSNSQISQLSATAKDYIASSSLKREKTVKSKLSSASRKKFINEIVNKKPQNMDSSFYNEDTSSININKSTNYNDIIIDNSASDIINSPNNDIVLDEKSASDLIKDNNYDYILEVKDKNNISKSSHTSNIIKSADKNKSLVKDKEQGFKYTNESKNAEMINIDKSIEEKLNIKFTDRSSVVDNKNTVLEKTEKAVVDSNNNIIQTEETVKNLDADFANVRNNSTSSLTKQQKIKNAKNFKKADNNNKSHTDELAQQLGINDANKKQDLLKSMVLAPGKVINKSVAYGKTAIYKSIKHNINETADESNDLGVTFVAETLNTIDNAKAAVKTAKASTAVVKKGVNVLKKSKSAAQATYKGMDYVKRNLKKLRNMKSNAHRMEKIAEFSIKAIKKVVVMAAKAVASSIASVVGIILPFLLIIIIICGVVAGVCSVIWNTSCDMDTTMIVKYISELDADMQSKWYIGYTNVDLERYNHTSHSTSKSCLYLLAKDVEPDIEPADGSIPPDSTMKVVIKDGVMGNGKQVKPTYRGFNEVYHSCDEFYEAAQWTTEDYRAALAYLQVKNDNLGWLGAHIGFIGESILKQSAYDLHTATSKQKIIEKTLSDGEYEYSYHEPVFNIQYKSDTGNITNYYCGRKFSVQYLIENNIVTFDDDPAKNEAMKKQYEAIRQYGNLAVGNLQFPFELSDTEKIDDKIIKHFGKQIYLKYSPPDYNPDHDVYGNVTKSSGYHYATDIMANANDVFNCPISGLCKVTSREYRGYEFVISTAYEGNNFDFTKNGYLVKISCAANSFIPIGVPTLVTKGQPLGRVAANMECNYKIPDSSNDSDEHEDIFANKLFPCCAATDYSSIGSNEYNIPDPIYNHLHIELYKLPCDFSNTSSINDNVLAPELYFDYSKEID